MIKIIIKDLNDDDWVVRNDARAELIVTLRKWCSRETVPKTVALHFIEEVSKALGEFKVKRL